MMGVHDEAIDTDFDEVIHCIGEEGMSSDLQERLRAFLSQRPKSCSQSGAQNEGCLESSSLHCSHLYMSFSKRTPFHHSIIPFFHHSKSLCLLFSELRINLYETCYEETRNGRGKDPEKEVGKTHWSLSPPTEQGG